MSAGTAYSFTRYNILSLPGREIRSRRRCVQRKLSDFRARITCQSKQASESKVTKHPGGRACISLGSLPRRQLRYLKRRIASLVRLKNPASMGCYIQPRALAQALPPSPVLGQARRYHVLFLPRLPSSTWVLRLSTTTPNSHVYVDPWMAQAHLSLSQQSNQLPAFPAILQSERSCTLDNELCCNLHEMLV